MGRETDNKTIDRKTASIANRTAGAKNAAVRQNNAEIKSTVGTKNTAATKGTANTKGTAGAKTATKKTGRKQKKSKSIAKKSASIFSKLTFKIAMYIIGIVIVILVCKGAYDFGTKIFSEEGMAEEGSGREVVVTIPADASTSEIASILKDNGLIESELIFKIQTILYEADIYSGTYTVNTEYNAEELIDALRPSDEED